MTEKELKDRTKKFAIDIFKLVELLPNSTTGRIIQNQIGRSASSVAANYRATCRGRSKAEFIAKLGVVLEEADESAFWLEMIIETNLYNKNVTVQLLKEANELVSIFVSSLKTIKSR